MGKGGGWITPWLASRVNIKQTPEARRKKYEFARKAGKSWEWASRMRDWPATKIFRALQLPVPPLAERKAAGLYPNPDDNSFLRHLMRKFGVKKLKIRTVETVYTWPDIWVEKKPVPVITVTQEWARQDTPERRKRLVHEFLHLRGLEHGKVGNLEYSTYPDRDSYSRMVYSTLRNPVVKKGVEFTGYVMLKHKACGGVTRYYVGPNYVRGWLSDGTPADPMMRIPCSSCGAPLVLGYGRMLFGRYVSEITCNAKCTGAVGPVCECSCGGKNHGAKFGGSSA